MKKKLALFYILLLSSLLFFTLNYYFPQKSTIHIISPLATTPEQEVASITTTFSLGLSDAVIKALEGTQGKYSVVIKNLATSETYTKNEKKSYPSASLYKLWTMAAVYQHITDGKLTKSQILSEKVEILNKKFQIATDAAEMTEGEITYSVENALERMITISHNYAALLLTNKIRVSSLNAFLKEYALLNSKTGEPPKTTAQDIALYFEKLYAGTLISKAASREMIELLVKQQLNDRIPKYLPDSVQIAHKTGELYGYKHDAGIVFTPKGDYIIVVLSESINSAQAAERIALISKNVYEYFQQVPKE